MDDKNLKKVKREEIKQFTEEGRLGPDNQYGDTWGEAVKEYLKKGYREDGDESEVVAYGETYKVLRRRLVTGFYDENGGTLFEVENKRLEKEYEWLMDGTAGDAAEVPGLPDPETVESSEADIQNDIADMPVTEIKREVSLKDDNSVNKADDAKKKYESSLKACKPHEKGYFEGPIMEHMFNRFEEDRGFCEDFLQGHKTFQKCIKYMIEKARKSVPKSEMQAMVEGSVYLEWMEDYFRKDDKVEEAKRAKKEAEDKVKREKAAAERKAEKKKEEAGRKAKAKEDPAVPVPQKKAEGPKELSKKKSSKDMEGQMDIFSMMGM